MVPRRVLPSSHEGPSNVEGCLPLDAANDLGHRVLRCNGQAPVHVLPQQVSLCNMTFLLLGSRAQDCSKRPPQLVGERLPTILGDKHPMLLAVPRGLAESPAVWHDKLPRGETVSGALEGVCCFDSRNCQTLGVPRQSRGFTLIKLSKFVVSCSWYICA
jgi:hypothetical protein